MMTDKVQECLMFIKNQVLSDTPMQSSELNVAFGLTTKLLQEPGVVQVVEQRRDAETVIRLATLLTDFNFDVLSLTNDPKVMPDKLDTVLDRAGNVSQTFCSEINVSEGTVPSEIVQAALAVL
jgi:hypothetical protein